MPLPSARRTHRLSHRVIVTLVAASLLSMPVTYRGGAEAAHAHTIFQLWEDVRTGSFTHHGAAAESRHGDHPGAHTGAAAQVGLDDGHAAMGEAMSRSGASTDPGRPFDLADVAAREPSRGSPTGTEAASLVGVDEDAPTASAAFTPDVRGSALAQTAMGTTAVARSSPPIGEEPSRMVGRVLPPVIPPPRTAA